MDPAPVLTQVSRPQCEGDLDDESFVIDRHCAESELEQRFE